MTKKKLRKRLARLQEKNVWLWSMVDGEKYSQWLSDEIAKATKKHNDILIYSIFTNGFKSDEPAA